MQGFRTAEFEAADYRRLLGVKSQVRNSLDQQRCADDDLVQAQPQPEATMLSLRKGHVVLLLAAGHKFFRLLPETGVAVRGAQTGGNEFAGGQFDVGQPGRLRSHAGRGADRRVEPQHFVSRNDLPCGSTIGPISAARVGIPTVDVGNPMLSMHSCREMAGSADVAPMIGVLRRFFEGG